MSIDQKTFNGILHAAMRAHDVDPEGSGGVAFEKMPLIARDVRREIDQIGATEAELHEYFDWFRPEICDQSMTQAGRNMAMLELAKGFGLRISLPS